MKLTKVVSVVSAGEAPVMDIEIGDSRHTYVARSNNGAIGVSHNSACISLSDLNDDRMRHAKGGEWYNTAPYRAMANNSAMYTEKPDTLSFMKEWTSIYESKSGERGIVNRVALKKQAEKFGMRDPNHEFVVNPCSEAVLRPNGLCNLSEVVVRPEDTIDSLKRKIRLATILGTVQSSLTNFKYVRDIWRENAEDERLLGVSMTGIFDNPLTNGSKGKRELAALLEELRDYATSINKEFSQKLGINSSAAITLVKPSGTVSALVDSASGIHPRFASKYVRRVRADQKDPLSTMMLEAGFPCEVDYMKPDTQYVFSFPMTSPEGAVVNGKLSAIEHLEIWRIYQNHWCHHKPSITVYVEEDEWMEVGAWVYKHFDMVSGVSFLPVSDSVYQQMPFEKLTEDEFNDLTSRMPVAVDWGKLVEYEKDDAALSVNRELACSGGSCEIGALSATEEAEAIRESNL